MNHAATNRPHADPRQRIGPRSFLRLLRATWRFSRHVAASGERTTRDAATMARGVVQLVPGGRAALVLLEVMVATCLITAALFVLLAGVAVELLDGWARLVALVPGMAAVLFSIPVWSLGAPTLWLVVRADRSRTFRRRSDLTRLVLDVAERETSTADALLTALGPFGRRLLGVEDLDASTTDRLAESLAEIRRRIDVADQASRDTGVGHP